MYVANRQIKYIPKGSDKMIVFQVGDKILDFEEWNIHAKRAHLNLDWVRLIGPGDEEEEVSESKRKRMEATDALEVRIEKGPEVNSVSDSAACAKCGKRFATNRAAGIHYSRAHKK